jgi:peptidoglycan/LPS O-acetylase OafA/YrhL
VAPKYRPDIDGLRAVAVLAVVAFHAFPKWVKGGFVGVDVFFVISGYLISSIILGNLRQGTFTFADFYTRRVKRIFPALLVTLAACFAFGWFALMADEYRQLGKHIASAAGFVSNFVLWGESGYFDNVAETKPLLHLWSLGIEEQFYLIWPFLLWAAWKRRIHLIAVLALIGGASFAVNVSLVAGEATKVFYSPQSRFWELLVGAALAYDTVFHARAAATARTREIRSLAGAALILGAAAFLSEARQFPGWWALLPTVGAYLVISAGPAAWFNRTVLASKPLVWVGLISYPLYLWHWPVLSLLRIIRGSWPHPPTAAMGVAVAFGLATLTYHVVEKPIRFGKRGPAIVFGLLAVMLATGFVGYNAFKRGGYGFRAAIRDLEHNRSALKRPPSIDDACKAYVGVPTVLFQFCRYSDVKGATTVAVVGDSHAHVAFPGIAERLAKRGVNTVLLGNSSCPPLFETPSAVDVEGPGAAFEASRNECAGRIKQIWGILAAKPEITRVFFVTRGTVYLTGHGFGEPEKTMARGPVVTLADFTAGIRKTAAELVRLGKQPYFVLENPEMGIDPAVCVARPFRKKAGPCSLGVDVVRARQRAYLDMFAGFHDAPVIATIEAFCPGGVCQAVRAGKLLYTDDDHLSVEGSRFQADEILAPYLAE